VGYFDRDIPIDLNDSREFNELLVGVQVLLDIIRQQQEETLVAEKFAREAQRRTSDILENVLDTTIK
jgi:hypothetical protein